MLWRRWKIRLNIYVKISFCRYIKIEALVLFPLVYYYYFLYALIEKKSWYILYIYEPTLHDCSVKTKNQFIRNSVKFNVDIVLSEVPRETSTWVNCIYIYPSKNKNKTKTKKQTAHSGGHRHTFSRFIYFKMNGTSNFTEIRKIAT